MSKHDHAGETAVEPDWESGMSEATTKPKRARRPRPPLSDDRSWDVQEVAYFLNVSASKVRGLEREGQLPALPRIGTRLLFDPRVVRAFRDGWRPPPGWRPGPPEPRMAGLDDVE